MRARHELTKGVICERCRRVVTKAQYKRIIVIVPVVENTTGTTKTYNRTNLCNDCYKEYENLMKDFLY